MSNGPIKKKPDEEEGWALSMADMMTNLLCFFVLLLAMSKIDEQSYRAVSESMAEAMGTADKLPPKAVQSSVRIEIDQKQKDLWTIQAELKKIVAPLKDLASVELRPDSVAVSLKGNVLFDSGRAELRPRDLQLLETLTAPLLGIPYRITVEGHTDNIPMQSAQFPSNWELSAARAGAVARYLISRGFQPDRLQIVGLADTKPTAPNMTEKGIPIPENQARNRRVVILVSP